MRPHLLLAAVALVAAPAAGQLMIAPTTVSIAPERRSAMVTVENGSDETVDLQLRAYDWTQPDGRDALAPADDVVVSPAIATVAPHGRQVFRILLAATAAPAAGREQAWRLRLNQLPRDGAPAMGINLEFLVPMFRGAAEATPRLAWDWTPDGRVSVTNTGDRRARLSRLTLAQAGGGVDLAGATSAYILSGATRIFAPASPAAPDKARLIAIGDTGTLDAMPAALAAR